MTTKQAPWDTSPATANQVNLAREYARRLHVEGADKWSELDTTQISSAIDRLRSVQRTLGMKFQPINGMDTSRGRR